jgi:hypothetical protein
LPLASGANDGLTNDERQTAMTLWSIGCSPLFIGGNLTALDNFDLGLITNAEVIAVNQAGKVATPVSQSTSQQVWRVANGNGTHTVALFNLGTASATVTANWSDLGFAGSASVRDLWTHAGVGTFSNSFSASLAAHGSRLFTVTPVAGPVTINHEAENVTFVGSGATASVVTDAAASGGKWVQLLGNSTNDYLELTLPAVPAGTYQVQLRWKTNNNRGKLTFKVDGTQLGSTLDQYASSAAYKTTTFGSKVFATTATHKIRLTVTGKNSASNNYNLSADAIILIKQ